jgi:hypothetical protein
MHLEQCADPEEESLMYRSKLVLGAAIVAGLAATQIASAEAPSAPAAKAAQGGLSITPAILETTARSGASRSATVTNSTSRTLRVTVRARPWRQSSTGVVAANRRRTLGAIRLSTTKFTLAAGARRVIGVRLRRVPSGRSQYGALDVVGKPARRRRGINVAYRLVSSLRFNPPAGARRLRLRAGSTRVSGRGSSKALLLKVRNRGNTVDPVGGSVTITGSGGGRSGTISSVRILPGKVVAVRLASLRGLRKGTYRASVTLTQARRNRLSATRTFRIR